MVDYLCELREGVLEAYTGIIQGLRGDSACSGGTVTPDLQLIESHLPYMSQFICEVSRDTDKSDGNIAAAAGLIGYVSIHH
jgi:importin subunit beta-1